MSAIPHRQRVHSTLSGFKKKQTHIQTITENVSLGFSIEYRHLDELFFPACSTAAKPQDLSQPIVENAHVVVYSYSSRENTEHPELTVLWLSVEKFPSL